MNFIKFHLCHTLILPHTFVVINHSWITSPILPLVIAIKSSTAIVICIVPKPTTHTDMTIIFTGFQRLLETMFSYQGEHPPRMYPVTFSNYLKA